MFLIGGVYVIIRALVENHCKSFLQSIGNVRCGDWRTAMTSTNFNLGLDWYDKTEKILIGILYTTLYVILVFKIIFTEKKANQLRKNHQRKTASDYAVRVDGLPLDSTPESIAEFFKNDEIIDFYDSNIEKRKPIIASVNCVYFIGKFLDKCEEIRNLLIEKDKCEKAIKLLLKLDT